MAEVAPAADGRRMISNQTVLIIGGSAGIGRAVATEVAEAGARVIVAGRDAAKASAAAQEISRGARSEQVDVADEKSVRALFERIGTIDHVATTPGFDHAATPVASTEPQVVEELFRTKFLGQYLVAKYAGSRLGAGGSLVLTSGFLAIRPAAGWAALSATNAAIEALAKALALEWAPRRVNVISPGIVDTGKRFATLPAVERRQKLHALGDKLPVRRVGLPGDLAGAYLFAMQNGFMTGQSIVVDGGGALV